jgi:hypothetical protein
MNQKLLFILVLLLAGLKTYAQDTIVETSRERVPCKVLREDSANVYFSFVRNGAEITTHLSKNEILSVHYGKKPEIQSSVAEKQPQNLAETDVASFGFGMGLDYGGLIGANFLIYPQRNVGLFLGGGYALVGFGYNAGIKLRFIGKQNASSVSPYLLGMYGYNAAIKITNAEEYNKIFYGPTFGFGLDIKTHKSKDSYFTLALLIPIRGPEVNDYINDLKNNHNVEFKSGLLPIAFSFGFRMPLD